MTDEEIKKMLNCEPGYELSDFQRQLCEYWATLPEPGPWVPQFYYSKEGDLLEVFLSNESYYGHWHDHVLTTLHSQGYDDPEMKDDVIGFGIWGGRGA